MVQEIRVKIDVIHTYIGDLKVELVAPSGRRVALHNRSGGCQDNLINTYDSGTNANLKALVGELVKDDWILWVSDQAGEDVGKLNKWSVEIGLEAEGKTTQVEAIPGVSIPDNDPTGVSNSLSIVQDGIVQKVAVGVDIIHPYIGDLRVEP